MTAYRALVVTPSGRQTWEEVEADTRAEVVTRLSIEGLVPLDVRPAGTGLLGKLNEPIRFGRGLGVGDQAMLLTQMALLVRFGLPVDCSLDLLRDQSAKGALRDALDRSVIKIRAGESLSQAFADQKLLPAYGIGVLRAAEQTGRLGEALATLAEQLTASATTRTHLITALTYPALVLASTLIALGIVLTVVVPAFAPIFAGNEDRLPVLTRAVLGFSAIVERWGWLLLTMLLALVAGLLWVVAAQDRSLLAARLAKRLPFRRLRLQYRGAQLLAVLGTLLTNGLTVVDALPLTAKAIRSNEWQDYLLGAERAVREGSSLSMALSRDPLLPTTAIRLLEVGERGGSLGHTCLKASTIMAEAAKAKIDRIVSLANPIAIILLGALAYLVEAPEALRLPGLVEMQLIARHGTSGEVLVARFIPTAGQEPSFEPVDDRAQQSRWEQSVHGGDAADRGLCKGGEVMPSRDIEGELEALAGMDLGALRYHWRKRFNTVPPKVSAGLLRLALAYDVQSSALGGLTSASESLLRSHAAARSMGAKVVRLRTAQPGMRLVRVWNGKVHVVTVNEAGEIEWNGKTWRSLSEVARAITGTQWSGPKFFGLRNKRVAA